MSSRSRFNANFERKEDASLASKVAMFNTAANTHQNKQTLNPFSSSFDQSSQPRKFNKDVYGKPIAGSLTEARGQKASVHVSREMLELCEIIDEAGFPQSEDTPEMKIILFGELFGIYTHISNKLVGLLLRTRKHKLVDFEGEMLYQRRDDDVPIFMLKPISEIREILNADVDEVERKTCPNPKATTLLMK